MVQSSMISAIQFLARIALAISRLFKKPSRAPARRAPAAPPPPTPTWARNEHGFFEYGGVSTGLRPALPWLEASAASQQPREGVRAFFIWRDVISPNYFSDLERMLELSKGRGREGAGG